MSTILNVYLFGLSIKAKCNAKLYVCMFNLETNLPGRVENKDQDHGDIK